MGRDRSSLVSCSTKGSALTFRGAYGNSCAFLSSSKATVGISGNTDSLFLSEALGVLGGSFSLGKVDSLKYRDSTLNCEGSVLCLNGEGSMSSLSAFAAVCLTDLIESSIRNRHSC